MSFQLYLSQTNHELDFDWQVGASTALLPTWRTRWPMRVWVSPPRTRRTFGGQQECQ